MPASNCQTMIAPATTPRASLFRRLGTIAKAIPTSQFHEVMLKELSEFIDWRARVVCRYAPGSLPELLFDEGINHTKFQVYLDAYYRLDPYYALCQSGPLSGVYTMDRDFPERTAYTTAYLPLAGWRDDVGVFFPDLGSASIGLFWEKIRSVKESELKLLEELYPLLQDMHKTHLLVVLGQLANKSEPSTSDAASYLITDRDADVVHRSETWPKHDAELPEAFAELLADKGGRHRLEDGTRLVVEQLPKSFADAPEGWVGVLERPGEVQPPTTMELALSRFLSKPVTPRESQILELILSGHSNASISSALGISVGSVKNHRVRLYRKLNISSERALVQLFVKHLTQTNGDP